jgi:hypothetical protein
MLLTLRYSVVSCPIPTYLMRFRNPKMESSKQRHMPEQVCWNPYKADWKCSTTKPRALVVVVVGDPIDDHVTCNATESFYSKAWWFKSWLTMGFQPPESLWSEYWVVIGEIVRVVDLWSVANRPIRLRNAFPQQLHPRYLNTTPSKFNKESIESTASCSCIFSACLDIMPSLAAFFPSGNPPPSNTSWTPLLTPLHLYQRQRESFTLSHQIFCFLL